MKTFNASMSVFLLLNVAGCSSPTNDADETPESEEAAYILHDLYVSYFNANESGTPESIDDLRDFLEQGTRAKVESGEVVVRYGINMNDPSVLEAAPILAYYRDVPTSGGLVVYATPFNSDPLGEPVTVTAEEFQAKLAEDEAAGAGSE